MIVSLEEIMMLPEFAGQSEQVIESRLKAVELAVRAYTGNNFQNRHVRFWAESAGNRLFGSSEFLRAGDTVQISQSDVNDGLYTITRIEDGCICIDAGLFSVPKNLVTKVEYPANIRTGVIDLMKWETANRQKVGIKSETLSRHSVTYYDQDVNNQVMGYPVSLLGFLKPYMKARF